MSETAKLTAHDGVLGDALGTFVAISGNCVAAGAPGAMIGSNTQQGAVYVFNKPLSGWKTTGKFKAKLTASDGTTGDAFGTSLFLLRSTVVVGAPNAVIGSNVQQGAAYVFGRQ